VVSRSDPAPVEGPRRGQLLRILGVGFGLAVAIGNTIGAGILRTPGEIASHVPNAWLFMAVWVLGGLYAMLGAIALAELGTMLPSSGGQYVFARYAIGDFAGFIVGWSDWLSTSGTVAAVSIVVGEYSGALFPSLMHWSATLIVHLPGMTLPVERFDANTMVFGGLTLAEFQANTIAVIVALIFGLIQWRGVRWGSGTQNITSLAKTIALLALVVACFVLGGKPQGAALAATSLPAGLPLFFALVFSLQSLVYTYDGWSGVVYFSEEVRDPGRDVPRALFGSILLIMGIYLLLNLALLYVLPISRIAGDPFPAGTASNLVFGAYGDPVIRTIMIVSMLSCVNACLLMASRVLFAMGRDRLFSERVATVNAGGTPTVALAASVVIALLFIVFGKQFEKVIEALAYFFVVNYTISFSSLFFLRSKEPDRPRPYRSWGYPWTTGLGLAASVAFLIGAIWGDVHAGNSSSIYALALVVVSYPVYRISKYLSARA
jgi:basic amino acid/polyamine antiporter, APA family